MRVGPLTEAGTPLNLDKRSLGLRLNPSLGHFLISIGSVSRGAAANIVLVGDQMQLPQPVQGVHPGETGLSSLESLLEDKATVPEDRGILLNETRRLHPTLCAFISEAIYDGRLGAHPSTADRQLVLRAGAKHKLPICG